MKNKQMSYLKEKIDNMLKGFETFKSCFDKLKSIDFKGIKNALVAFSVFELIIALVAVSAISVGFTPIITKQLKNSLVTTDLSNMTLNCSGSFSSDCKFCSKNQCVICLKDCGKYTGRNNSECKCCPDNALSCENSSSVATSCSEGYELKNGACVRCQPGKYCPKGNPKGAQVENCNGNVASGSYQGYYCPNGLDSYHNDDDTRGRVKCPKGYKCPDNTQSAPSPCPAGYYQDNEQQITCICNPVGYVSVDTARPKMGYPCHVGQIQPLTCQTLCNDVPCGYYQDEEGKTQAKICPVGTYNSNTGQDKCLDCPRGAKCPNQGTCDRPESDNRIIWCPCGHYQPNPRQTTCLETAAGRYQDGIGQTVEKPCPKGYKCPIQKVCNPTACPSGCYQPNTGQTDCKPCDAGYYCPSEGTIEKIECPSGYYCPQTANPATCGTSTSTPKICDCGTYCPKKSSTPTKCPDGYYCPQKSAYPTSCTYGHYCKASACSPSDNTKGCCEPIACPAGQYQNERGKSTCKPCPIGHYCPSAGTIKPIPCAVGTYALTEGKTVCDPCSTADTPSIDCNPSNGVTKRCQQGFYYSGTSNTKCTICPRAYRCPDGIHKYRCLDGETSGTGAINCEPCADGWMSRPTSGTVGQNSSYDDYCRPCEKEYKDQYGNTIGHVQGQSHCKSCDKGTGACKQCHCGYTLQKDASGNYTGACRLCNKGEACWSGVTGETCAAGTHSERMLLCSTDPTVSTTPGQYSSQTYSLTTQVQWSKCDACAGGYWSNAGEYECHKCSDAPKYCVNMATYCAKANGTCTRCINGYYHDSAGVCHLCPAAYYCKSSNCTDTSAECEKKPCGPGYKCETTGMSGPTACPTGTYSSATANSTCTNCAANHCARTTGSSSCTACDASSSPANSGGLTGCSATTCDATSCASGWYKEQGTWKYCKKCPTGNKCDGSTKTACDAKYCARTEGSSSCTACDDSSSPHSEGGLTGCTATTCDATSCASGWYIEQGTWKYCKKCPRGSSCDGTTKTACAAKHCASSQGSSSCTACDASSSPANEGAVSACDADDCDATSCASGWYIEQGTHKYCKKCPAGSYCNGTTKSACAAKTCARSEGSSSCTACDAYSSPANQGAVSACTANTCDVTSCAAGWYIAQGTWKYCKKCPAHCTACTGDHACTACDANYFVYYSSDGVSNSDYNGTCIPTLSNNVASAKMTIGGKTWTTVNAGDCVGYGCNTSSPNNYVATLVSSGHIKRINDLTPCPSGTACCWTVETARKFEDENAPESNSGDVRSSKWIYVPSTISVYKKVFTWKKKDGTYQYVGGTPTLDTTVTVGAWSSDVAGRGTWREVLPSNWKAAGSSSTKNPLGYGYLKRTVCNWYAADMICQAIGMTLPTTSNMAALRTDTTYATNANHCSLLKDEVFPSASWKNIYSYYSGGDSNGQMSWEEYWKDFSPTNPPGATTTLNLCDSFATGRNKCPYIDNNNSGQGATTSGVSEKYKYSIFLQCEHVDNCKGAKSDECRAAHVWGVSADNSNAYYMRLHANYLSINSGSKTIAASVRCVNK